MTYLIKIFILLSKYDIHFFKRKSRKKNYINLPEVITFKDSKTTSNIVKELQDLAIRDFSAFPLGNKNLFI